MKKEKREEKSVASGNAFEKLFFGKHLAEISVAVLIIALYYSVLSFGYTRLDDNLIIERNMKLITDFSSIGKAFTTDAFFQEGNGSFYRPLQSVSYILDAKVFGTKPQDFHIGNLLLHIFTTVLAYRLLLRLGLARSGAYVASLIFAVHPLFTHAVAWIPARGDLLLAFFSIVSAIFYARYADRNGLTDLILSAMAFLLAALSKESAVVLPILLLGIGWFVGERTRDSKRLIRSMIPFALGAAVWFVLRNNAVQGATESELFGLGPFIRNIQTIPDLVSKFFLPIDASPMPAFNIAYTIIGCFYLIAAIVFGLKNEKDDRIAVILGLAWFLALTIPGMAFRHSEADHFFDYLDHRAYLPSIGLLPVLACLFTREWKRFPRSTAGAAVFVVLALSTAAFVRANDYRSPETFALSAIKHNPKAIVAYTNLGAFYSETGKPREAFDCLSRALESHPNNPEVLINRADAASKLGMIDTARKDLFNVIDQRGKNYPLAVFNLGSTYLNAEMYDSSIARFREALATKPVWPEAVDNIAKAFFNNATRLAERQNYPAALPLFDSSLATKPDYTDALNNRGNTRWLLGDHNGACEDWSRSASLGNRLGRENTSKYCGK